jgi:cyclopropane-fatty-acyl-phospholipid synthase
VTAVGYRGASAAAIRHHYDLGNDFYALWLDPTLSYSCALWDGEDDTLQAAQERKLDYLARESGAVGAARVLDIGFGWGGLLRRLVEQHGVGHVTGLTLSQAQADFVAERVDDRYDLRVQNWSDHEPAAGYDAIISIGAFEHFADSGMTRGRRVDGYRHFFERCREWLPLGGKLAVQSIVKGSNVRLDRQMVREMLFVNRQIFPESEVPWPSEMFEACERMFDVRTVRYDAEHYARTCRHWLDGLRARRAEAELLVGEEAVAGYERYLAASVVAFRNRHVGLMRAAFERVV